MPEYTDEEDAKRLWDKGFTLLMKDKDYNAALSCFYHILEEFNVANQAKGVILTGIAEAEFSLGNSEKAIKTNIDSLNYYPGRRDTYRRTIYMANKSRNYIYVPYMNYLYIKNFRKVYAELKRVVDSKVI